MKRFMEMACAQALEGISKGEGGPFGAVIVKDGRLIAGGHNMVIGSNDSTAHGEITAIREAERILGTYDLSGCELYTTCYPCPMCLAAIMWARISKVYYGCTAEDAAAIGFDDDIFYRAMESPDFNGLLTVEQEERESCLPLFEKWESSDKKKMY